MARFRFCKRIDEPADVARVRDYVELLRANGEAMARMQRDAAAIEKVILDELSERHKAPRGLTMLVDPRFVDELGYVVLYSREVEEGEDETEPPEPRHTVH